MKKNIIIGFIISIFVTLAGIYIYLEYIMKNGFEESWQWMLETQNQGTIISLGAIPNLLLFFVFLKRKEELKARGVMIGVVVAALAVFYFRFF